MLNNGRHKAFKVAHAGVSAVRCILAANGQAILRTGFGNWLARIFGRLVVAISPDSPGAHERLGDALLYANRFEGGISHWRKALSLQFDDKYSEIYNRSLSLLHRGQTDAMIDILRMGIEMQEEYARAHGLDKFGVRFLREWTYAIGHMALLDIYIKMGMLGWREPYRSIILDARPANRAYLEYWRRYLPEIITDPEGVSRLTPLATRLEEHLHVINAPGGRKIDYVSAIMMVQNQWESEGRKPLLTLSDADRKRGREYLKTLGVPLDAWFVSLHVRDTSSDNARDANINTYRMAIESITARGGWVIRMGEPSMPPLAHLPQVIDYAHNKFRNDWMDVFLWADARFFIGTRSGPAHVPPTFGKPCVLTNSFPMAMPFPYRNIDIYKLYRSEKENRFLSFKEACAIGVGFAESHQYRKTLGIGLVDNSPEEINDAVLEMLDLLDGRLIYSDEDDKLQAAFKTAQPSFKGELSRSPGRVSRRFLNKYAHLL